jgi:heparanase 1
MESFAAKRVLIIGGGFAGRTRRLVISGVFWIASITTPFVDAQSVSLDPAKMHRIGIIDERFQSYNIEMLEVTGGKFWRPYSSLAKQPSGPVASSSDTPAGMDPTMYEFRPPVNLANARLRRLAEALGPAYVRVSGTWANTTYFKNSPGPAPQTPPAGFGGVLTQQQWKGVVDFSLAVNAELVTSVAISPGVRDASGKWMPAEATKIFAFTKTVGGTIAATEFMNEPNAAAMGGAPKGYNSGQYGKDLGVFRSFLANQSPKTILLGPGSVGEGGALSLPPSSGIISSADLLRASGAAFDAFSFHVYPAVSQRCSKMGASMGTTAADALSAEWLARPQAIETYYSGLRDKFDPGKPLWITETADAACGGNPWASTFLDTFRYLNQLGMMARDGVQVVMHNTLDSSDYGLLREGDFAPRPNFWAAVLWRRLMGTVVLQAEKSPSSNLYLYAHCLRDVTEGVAILAINADQKADQTLSLPGPSQSYMLSAEPLQSTRVRLNNMPLELGANDALPELSGSSNPAGTIKMPPMTIMFIGVPEAGNHECR